MLAFGHTGGLPAGTDTAWGCQATITPTGTINVDEERTDLVGPRAAQLRDHLQQHVGAVWRDRAREAVRAAVLGPGHAGEVVLYHDATVVIKAATHESDGDLHVCAYLLAPPPP
jgi:hypothetical protein